MGKSWKAPKLVARIYTTQSYHCSISRILWSPSISPDGDHIMKRCQILKHLSRVCLNISFDKDTSNSLCHNCHTHTHTCISHYYTHPHLNTHIHLSHKALTAPPSSILYSPQWFQLHTFISCVGNCQTSGNNDVPISVRASQNNWRHQLKSLYKWFHSSILLSTLGI